MGVQNRHSKPLPRGHKALESLKGSGPSAQTVANPAQSIRVPDHHSPPAETREDTRDSYHKGSQNDADQSREPPAPQQRFPPQKKDLKKSQIFFHALPNPNNHQRDPPATSMHAGANSPPHNAANHRRDPVAIPQRILASAYLSPETNGFTTSQVSSSHYSPSQQATFHPNAVAGPSGSQGMSPFDSARYDRTPFGGIKKYKSKRR